jgi:hypothetical protein
MDPEDLTAISVLAGMGILTEDDNLVDAAISEILGLSLEQRYRLDPQGNITYLLIQHHLGQARSILNRTKLDLLTSNLGQFNKSSLVGSMGCVCGACPI